jgi:membrane protease YdiL (CAAX protease family)
MRLAFVALLLLVLALLVLRAITRERRGWARFQRLTSTRARQRMYRRWLVESVVVMGGLSAVLLIATGNVLDPALRDAQAWAPLAAVRGALAGGLGAGVAIGLGIAFLAGALLPVILLRGRIDEIPAVGGIQALLPRNRQELPYGVGLGLSAGVFEETMFRLALPALIFGIVPNGPAAFVASSVVFGLLHMYQRWTGVLFATLLGLLLSAAYVLTGLIAVPVALHALIDLRSLVLIPLALGTAARHPDA